MNSDEGSQGSAAPPTPQGHNPAQGHDEGHGQGHGKGYFALLTLSALGIVYGDIGTSPLYALRESLHHGHGLAPTSETILGIISLLTWALILVVSVKYLAFVLRADLHGEGGILTLTALATRGNKDIKVPDSSSVLALLGLFGTALLYGEGIITPAISVLSAVEGLKVATPVFEPYILPITITILVALFCIQFGGTEKVGRVFGPITLVWFLTLFALGLHHIVQEPSILKAFNPLLGLKFLFSHGWKGYLVLGSVVLVITGAEALYADMGHFGRQPIRFAWFSVVLPSLLVNYYGQGALLLAHPETVDNPFFKMVPKSLLYPVVLLATAATVIASQALISGCYSLTMQAIRLGYLPRLRVIHTSEHAAGQIYVPFVNWFLMIACIALVLGFRSSSALAAAYGLAVTGAMVITTVLLFRVARSLWGWGLAPALALCSIFMIIDLAFFGANVIKIPAGGWFPLVFGLGLFTVMTTWFSGRRILGAAMRPMSMPLEEFRAQRVKEGIARVPGVAVFLAGAPHRAPPALLNNVRFNQVLHEKVVFVSVSISDRARVDEPHRISCESLGDGYYQVLLRFGYLEKPDVPAALASIPELGMATTETVYFLGREIIIPTRGDGMAPWREHLFVSLSYFSQNATAVFNIPSDRVIEVGSQIRI